MSRHHYHHRSGVPLPVLGILVIPVLIGMHACNDVGRAPVAKAAAAMPAPVVHKPKEHKGWEI